MGDHSSIFLIIRSFLTVPQVGACCSCGFIVDEDGRINRNSSWLMTGIPGLLVIWVGFKIEEFRKC